MDEKTNENDSTVPVAGNNVADTKSNTSKRSALRWILPLILVALVLNVVLRREKATIDWTEDHGLGLKLANKQDKPVLVIFFKANTGFCNDAWDGAYTNPRVIDYAAKNLVTIFIDIDKQPELAKEYKIDYYPTHILLKAGSNEVLGSMRGYDPPTLFISKIENFLGKTSEPE